MYINVLLSQDEANNGLSNHVFT